ARQHHKPGLLPIQSITEYADTAKLCLGRQTVAYAAIVRRFPKERDRKFTYRLFAGANGSGVGCRLEAQGRQVRRLLLLGLAGFQTPK
ncbi:MAG: hypothetical protein WB611_28510, partial [Stellaceae bacterium]